MLPKKWPRDGDAPLGAMGSAAGAVLTLLVIALLTAVLTGFGARRPVADVLQGRRQPEHQLALSPPKPGPHAHRIPAVDAAERQSQSELRTQSRPP